MIEKYFKGIDLPLDEKFYKRCNIFIEGIQKWGRIHNLTSCLDQEFIIENIVDSIYPLQFVKDFDTFADIGTGSGYPGLFIAMVYDEKISYLIEPRNKHVGFLNYMCASMGLKNVKIIPKRVEDFILDDVEIDLIASRAVTNIKTIFEISDHLCCEKTNYLLYKGSIAQDELNDDFNHITKSRGKRKYFLLSKKDKVC